jgi:hypothetical protein
VAIVGSAPDSRFAHNSLRRAVVYMTAHRE